MYLTNRSPTSQLDTTPYKALHGEKPDLLKLQTFGCAAYAFDEHAKSHGKMAAQTWKGVHLGYRLGSNQYRIYHPEKKKVFERRDVKFHEGRNLPVGDNDDRSKPELDADEGDTALLPNTLL